MARRTESDVFIGGKLQVNQITNLVANATRFAVVEPGSGEIKYRTSTQILDDIDAAPVTINIDQVLANGNTSSRHLQVGSHTVTGQFVLSSLGVGTLKVDHTGLVYSDASSVVDETDYDYNIIGTRNGINQVFRTQVPYIAGSTKLYINGIRMTEGIGYDYSESGANILTIYDPPLASDLITVDYKIQL